MKRSLCLLGKTLALALAVVWAACWPTLARAEQAPVQHTLAQRLKACTACHGLDGRAGPDGYYPRLAGKPPGYLYNQLRNFREGRRQYGPMVWLLDHLTDDYLLEIAGYFSGLDHPYPPPLPIQADASTLARGRQLALQGDAALRVPACVRCHGEALTGVAPSIPGLLGLPRDYLAGQLGAWASGNRQAHRPDCMADIAKALTPQDVGAVTAWLTSQAWPVGGKPAFALPAPMPRPCGGVSLPGSPS
jgi:cytochrome c553